MDVYVDDMGEDDNGDEIELDLSISQSDFEGIANPIVQRAIDISNNLLQRNNLSGKDLDTVMKVLAQDSGSNS